MKAITVVSLFDGISCGQLALQRAGIPVERYFASEIKPHAIKIAQKHFPQTIQMGDVRNICFESLGKIDLLIGGSPCQDLSKVNNAMQGLKGKNSSLFFEYARALEELKPKYFLFENVAMPPKDFEIISQTLGIYPVNINSELLTAQLRNRFYWTNIGEKNYNLFGFPTCAIPQPKNRRIFFNSIKEENVDSCFDISQKRAALFRRTAEGNAGKIGTVQPGNSKQKNEVFGTKGKIHCILASDRKAAKILLDNNRLRYITPLECERLQTLPDNYTEGLSNRKRLDVIGDGWTVEVIAYIFSYLKEELENN